MNVTAPLLALSGARVMRRLVNAAFHIHAKARMARLSALDPLRTQERTLRKLAAFAARTRFGRDHDFARIRTVDDFRRQVPVRDYESLWNDYLREHYPRFEDLTWPGTIPYIALSSGTTQGTTKYIPVSREMVRSNRKAAQTVTASHMTASPGSRLFEGRIFFLGGSTALEEPSPGIRQGDLSGVAATELSPALRPYTFPQLELALEPDWDRKLQALAECSLHERITLVSGVPSWLLALFRRVLDISGARTIASVWPSLEMVVHGGVRFDPYARTFRDIVGSDVVTLQETYPCSEGFIAFGDRDSGLLRLIVDHGIFYEFIPAAAYREGEQPTDRRWLAEVEVGVDYVIVVTTCAGMWAHVIGDTVRFESLDPPLLRFTGRTKYSLSAFGEHLILDEVEAAVMDAAQAAGASLRDWHVGPVFAATTGFHQYVVEFDRRPLSCEAFRTTLDESLARRNDDYRAHRARGAGIASPALVAARLGAFEAWMRRRGKLGGQNKVPRMDVGGLATRDLIDFIRASNYVDQDIPPGDPP